jgi:hypothetical protein
MKLLDFAKYMKQLDARGWEGFDPEDIVWEMKNNNLYSRELSIWEAAINNQG